MLSVGAPSDLGIVNDLLDQLLLHLLLCPECVALAPHVEELTGLFGRLTAAELEDQEQDEVQEEEHDVSGNGKKDGLHSGVLPERL